MVLVTPPFSGGLHCGRYEADRGGICARSPRRSAAGSIAAASGSAAADVLAGVTPPFSGGLHCGFWQQDHPHYKKVCHPAVQRRAPVRPRTATIHRSSVPRSPRRSAAGSIAARLRAPRQPAVVCHPAVQRRAPLRPLPERPVPERRARVTPPFSGGLHCGPSAALTGIDEPKASVTPPFSGGLHCGWDNRDKCYKAQLGHPAVQRRAPLRRETLGGLRADDPGHPAVQRRAPLRRDCRDRECLADRSPRRSAAGSIAASSGRSRPRSTAGSHPAVQRRAPLRPDAPTFSLATVVVVTPPFSGGLHCGLTEQVATYQRMLGHPAVQRRAPLRPGSRAVTRPASRVTPPFSGGLHCGSDRRNGGYGDPSRSPRRSAAGSIAAGRATDSTVRRDSGHPAVQRRAPLRPGNLQGGGVGLDVTPPFSGGLHCGGLTTGQIPGGLIESPRRSAAGSIAAGRRGGAVRVPGRVTPPFSGGLHCGASVPCGRENPMRGHPAVQRRAPLRRARRDGVVAVLGQSPRRSAAGSIAAPGATPTPGCRAWSPRRSAAGSIAACAGWTAFPSLPASPRRSAAGSIAASPTASAAPCRPRVTPPFSGGLHCGALRRPKSHYRTGRHPAVQRRAPLRRQRRTRGTPRRQVTPPFSGGLHCGERPGPWTANYRDESPRRSAAGSIAAARSTRPSRPARGSPPRRSAAGSIAAGRTSVTGRLSSCVTPPFSGGLHCGETAHSHAPASHAGSPRRSAAGSIAADSSGEFEAADRLVVTPPFSGGLHCGVLAAGRLS